MQIWVAQHECFDAIDIVVVDRLLEFADLFEGIDVGLELRPAREAVEAGDLELCVRDGFGAAGLEQIPGLALEVAEIGTFGKGTRRVRGMVRHGELLSSKRLPSAHRAERSFAKNLLPRGGLLPFPRTGCVPTLR